MTEAVQTLKRQRVRMILVNLAYFMVLLLLGVLLFLQNDAAGVTGYLLVAACPGGISPAGAAHEQTVRQCGAGGNSPVCCVCRTDRFQSTVKERRHSGGSPCLRIGARQCGHLYEP